MVEQEPNEERPEEGRWRIPTEIYSRICGYLRPVQNWHPGKQQEFEERREFDLVDWLEREGRAG